MFNKLLGDELLFSRHFSIQVDLIRIDDTKQTLYYQPLNGAAKDDDRYGTEKSNSKIFLSFELMDALKDLLDFFRNQEEFIDGEVSIVRTDILKTERRDQDDVKQHIYRIPIKEKYGKSLNKFVSAIHTY